MARRVSIPHNGMLFPSSYYGDAPEPPEPPDGYCPECDTPLEFDGDKYEGRVWCPDLNCDFERGGGLL